MIQEQKKKHLSASQLIFACGLLFLFALLLCLYFYPRRDRNRFLQFSEELFLQEMTANTISLHYSLAHPESYGITEYPVTLPFYRPGSELTQNTYSEEALKTLQSISPIELTPEERYVYQCLESSLTDSLRIGAFPYYSDPLSPTQGLQSKLPILFSEYAFRSARDVEEYLTLLQQTGLFFESLLQYEREKASGGIMMSKKGLQKVQDQCDTIVTSEAMQNGTHFLQLSFRERLQELAASTSLDAEELRTYLEQNDRLLKEVLLPAYQHLKAGLQELESLAPEEEGGLATLPLGREYYEALLSHETGSAKTVEEIRALLEQTLALESDTIRRLAGDYPGCLPSLKSGSYTDLGIDDAYVMIQDLIQRMKEDFPALTPLPGVTLKDVSPSLQDYSAPAFYLTAPADETDRNVIYINQKTSPRGLELYVTLAHEGYPGHLYQNATMASYCSPEDPGSLLRLLISPGGYLEGWALYVEQHSYDYASRLLYEQGRSADAVCVQMEKHNRSLQLCLYSLLDLIIHYDGAGPEEVLKYLSPFGIKDPNTAELIYEYICESPANYPKYYLGYLEILELKQEAEILWGDAYSDTAFHEFLLKWGPADFTNLRRKLEDSSLPLLHHGL